MFGGTKRTLPEGRVRELDGLRGLAVLAVMAYHYGLPSSGFLGVDVFFVLSGYLITGLILAGQPLLTFYRRRAIRLLPALGLMLAIVGLTVPFDELLPALTLTENVHMAFDPQPIPQSLYHIWTLSLEWQFYLVWPVLLVLALRWFRPLTIGRALLIPATLCALWRITLGDDWFRAWMGPDARLDGLLLGCAIALGARLPFPRWALAVLLVGSITAKGTPSPLVTAAGIPIVELATGALILSPPRWLAFGPLTGIGRISYGLYLWHVPIIALVSSQALPLLLAPVLTLAAALVSWRVIEDPLLRLRPSGAAPAERRSGRSDTGSDPLAAAPPSSRSRSPMSAAGSHESRRSAA